MTTPPQHSERTPLLRSAVRDTHQAFTETVESSTISSPAVLPYLAHFKTGELPSDNSWCPEIFTSEGGRTAFILLAWLHHAKRLRERAQVVDDIWEQWAIEVKDTTALLNIEQRTTDVWEAFLSVPRSPFEVEEVLWRPFPLRGDGHSPTVRVIDYHAFFPRAILSHRVLELSMRRVWKQNLAPTPRNGSAWNTIKRTPWMVSTPRNIHAIDLLGLVAYLSILVRYSLDPPDAAVEETMTRQILRSWLIPFYGIATFLQEISWTRAPFLLTATAFLFTRPAPSSSDLGYSVVLIALCAHIIQLHIPSSPSPIYLFPFAQALPLATLIWNGFAKIYLPVVLLFLPALLVAAVLLSFSLADVATISATTVLASPLEARTVFLLLLVVLLLLLICSLGMLVLVYPFISSHSSGSPWDRYSTSLGLDARRSFVRTVLYYTSPHARTTVRTTSSIQSPVYMRMLFLVTLARRILWCITVGPTPILLISYLLLEVLT